MEDELKYRDLQEEDSPSEPFSFKAFCAEGVSLLITAYIFVIFCILPFYMQNGYVSIGKDKFLFYRDITIGAFCLILPFALLSSLLKIKSKHFFAFYKRLSVTDAFVLLYALAVCLSYVFSDFKNVALWGEEGWYMGLLTQLMFLTTYFLITRYWECEERLIYGFLAAAAVVFALGILNRYSIYPLIVAEQNNGFLSTLGNINWYCGFWAVAFPTGFFLYWSAKSTCSRILLGLYCLLAFGTGVSQGSNSSFLVFVAVFLLGFLLSFSSFQKMRRFFELCALCALSCQLQRFWRLQHPTSFNYYSGSLSDTLTISRVSLYALIPIAILYFLLLFMEKIKKQNIKQFRMIRQITVLLSLISIGVYILLLILNSNISGGIRFMAQTSALTFSEYWGSSRGGTWAAGYRIFQSMNPVRKLIGAGPDCFAMYLYNIESIAEAVTDQFHSLRLTNAHCEWLTVLVNQGILGAIGYAGMFLTGIFRFLRFGLKQNSSLSCFVLAAGAALFSYTIHNIVSFQQILSTPFIFILIAIGERMMREVKTTKNNF